MSDKYKEWGKNFGYEILDGIRNRAEQRLDDVAFEERKVGIQKATCAMIEVGVEEKKIIEMLQKYWDLRLSEAEHFLIMQHNNN